MNAMKRATEFRRDYESRHEEGRRTFGMLLRGWFRRNGWSNIPASLEVHKMMGGTRWLHNSQIAQLMNANVTRCATQQFYCLAELNRLVWAVKAGEVELPADMEEGFWLNAEPLLNEDGSPMDMGDLMDVWFGDVKPSNPELELEALSEAAGRLMKACEMLFRSIPPHRKVMAIAEAPEPLREHLSRLAFEQPVEVDDLMPLVPLLEDWLKAQS